VLSCDCTIKPTSAERERFEESEKGGAGGVIPEKANGVTERSIGPWAAES